MQRQCEWASDPRHRALAQATWWRWGEGRMGFHAPLGSNSAQPELKHRKSWQQKLRGKTKEVLF